MRAEEIRRMLGQLERLERVSNLSAYWFLLWERKRPGRVREHIFQSWFLLFSCRESGDGSTTLGKNPQKDFIKFELMILRVNRNREGSDRCVF